MKNNRILALLLAIVMVVGLLPLAAMATGTTTVTVEASKAEVDQDDVITFTVSIQSTEKVMAVTLYPVIPAGLTYVAGSCKIVDGAAAAMGATQTGDVAYFEEQGDVQQLGIAVGAADGLTGITSKLAVATFQCKAEKGGNYEVSMGVGEDGDIGDINGASVEFTAAPATVSVKKTKITPDSLTLTYADTLAIADKNFSGTAAAAISGKDDEGDDLPASELAKVTYTVDKAWAAVAADGTVSIKDIAAAEAGNITVTAKLGTVTTTATVAVTKAAATVETVTVAGPTAAIIKADENQNYTFTATVKDQYGAEMAGQTIAWTTEPSTLPEGLTFADGVLTVSKDTPAASKGDVKITATVGGKTGEITTKVTDIEFPGLADAVKVATKATYGDKWSKIVTIPATFAGKAGETVVNGTLTLKYDGEEIPAAAEEGPAFQVIFNAEGFENVVAFEGKAPAIAKKPVTVTVKDVDVKIGDDMPAISNTEVFGWTADGLVGDDEITGTASYAFYAKGDDGEPSETATSYASITSDEAAEYAIVASGLTASDNYDLTVVPGALTIKKKSSLLPNYGFTTKPGEPTGGNGQNNDPVEKTPTFEDVTADDWFFDAVEFVADKKLFNGTSETTFSPNANMTRAMVATVLFRLDGAEKTDVAAAFEDVAEDTWYTDGVAWAAEKGVVTGYSETVFAPDDNVTREQLAVMLYRYVGEPEVDAEMGMAGFNDVDAISEWAATAMRWAVQNGILVGKDGAMLDPAGNATRAEVATMLQRFVNLEK